MSKHVAMNLLAGLVLLSLFSWAFYFNDVAFAGRILGIAPPKESVRAISSDGSEQLVSWFMGKDEFEDYKKDLFKVGFYTWKQADYDASEPSTFRQKVLVGGFPKGSGATVIIGDKIISLGKSSAHVFYDYLTGEFIAMRGYGAYRSVLLQNEIKKNEGYKY